MCRRVPRVIAAGPKQASLSCRVRVCSAECVHVFDRALAVVSRQPLLRGQQEEAGGKVVWPAGRWGDAARNPQSSEMLRLGLAAPDFH